MLCKVFGIKLNFWVDDGLRLYHCENVLFFIIGIVIVTRTPSKLIYPRPQPAPTNRADADIWHGVTFASLLFHPLNISFPLPASILPG